jgi:ubiquitin-like protein Pup
MRFILDAMRTQDDLPLYRAADSTQKQKPKSGGGDEPEGKGEGTKKLAKKGEELKEEMDNLVDEIDAVLEENAEEFVKNYVQRGGE